MKFAHLSDIHLGAFNDEAIKKVLWDSFIAAIRDALIREVEFIIIAGDLFHNNVPDMNSAKVVAEVLREIKDKGIKTFVVYGSHDYSLTENSMIDVLEKGGLIIKISRNIEGKVVPYRDEKLGINLYGIDARKNGIEADDIRKAYFKREEGFNILVLHTTVNELLPSGLSGLVTGVSKDELPNWFDYYALGHIHYRALSKINGKPVVQPGALFGSSLSDLLDTGRGVERGYYIYDNGNLEFVPISIKKVYRLEKNVTGLEPKEIKIIDNMNDSIVILDLKGNASFSREKIEYSRLRKEAHEHGAYYIFIRDSEVIYPQKNKTDVKGTRKEIEDMILSKYFPDKIRIAREIFDRIAQPKQPGESNESYETRIRREAMSVAGIYGED